MRREESGQLRSIPDTMYRKFTLLGFKGSSTPAEPSQKSQRQLALPKAVNDGLTADVGSIDVPALPAIQPRMLRILRLHRPLKPTSGCRRSSCCPGG